MRKEVFEKTFLINCLFLILIFLGTFLVARPSGNVNDQATENLMIQYKLVEYHKSGYHGSFSLFLWEDYQKFHKKQLNSDLPPHIYGLSTSEVTYFNKGEQVKALQRLIEYLIHLLTFRIFDLEVIFVGVALIILLLTFVFAYLFGRELIGKTFGTIVAVVVTGNVYFSQLIRSYSEPQIALYPLLFFMSFFFLFQLHLRPAGKKMLSAGGLSFSLALLVLNGYPNTLVVLLPFVISFACGLRDLSSLNLFEDRRVSLAYYPIILLCGSLLYLALSGIWGWLFGEHFLYHLSLFQDRIALILSGQETTGSFFETFSINGLQTILSRIFGNLLSCTPVLYPAHMPGMLVHQNFLNPIEGICLAIGAIAFVPGILRKKLINYFLLGTAIFFIIRAATNDNFLIRKRNFDYYFVVLIFISYGIFFVFQSGLVGRLFKKDFWKFHTCRIRQALCSKTGSHQSVGNDAATLTHNGSTNIRKGLLIIVLVVSTTINIISFNSNFIYKHNENLGLLNGMYEVRQVLDDEASNGKNLVFFDYEHGDTFIPSRLTFLRGSFEYDVLKHLKKRFPQPETMWKNFGDKTYDSIYIIMPGPIDRRGKLAIFRGFRPNQNHEEYYSFADNYKVIRNRQGVPAFFINKLNSEKRYYSKEILSNSGKKGNIHFPLKENERLDFIDIPGNVKESCLRCGSGEPVIIELDDVSYDNLHFTFDDNSLIEIFNNYKLGVKNNNIIELHADTKEYATADFEKKLRISPGQGQNAVAYIPNRKSPNSSSVIFNYDIGFPVREVLVNVSYFLFNDKAKKNEICLQWRCKETDRWITLSSVKSNGTERYDVFTFYRNPGHLTGNMTGIFDVKGEKGFQIRYLLKSPKIKDEEQVGIFTTYWPTSNIRVNARNFLRIGIDTSELKSFKKNYQNTLEMEFKLNDEGRHPTGKSLIGVGAKVQ